MTARSRRPPPAAVMPAHMASPALFAVAVMGALTLLTAVLAAAGILAGPVCLGLIGAFLLLGVRVTAHLYVQLTLTRRACELAENVEDLLLVTPAEVKMTGVSPPVRLRGAFWSLLGESERRILTALGQRRTYQPGTVLFSEGASAEHVAVVLDGWTRICVQRRGRQRVIAERGPGQLIGERAALRPSVRSASVVAMERVTVLLLTTEDFAGFLGRHPHVLEIIEGQIYDRLAEPLDGASCDIRDAPPARPHFDGQHCTVVFLDVANFAAGIRNDEDRRFVRHLLLEVLRTAFRDSGLGELDGYHWEDRGDGSLIIIPPEIPTRTVLADLIPQVVSPLQQHNRRSAEPVRVKLRAAVHAGPVYSDEAGVSGESIIHAARILDANIFKRSLAGSAACLGVIVSSVVFRSVVRHNVESLSPHEYDEIQATVKESTINAYMRLTGPILVPATG